MNSQAHTLFGGLLGVAMILQGRGLAGKWSSRCLDAAADNRGLADLWWFLHRLNGLAWDFGGFGSQNKSDRLFSKHSASLAGLVHFGLAHDGGELVEGDRAGEIPPAIAPIIEDGHGDFVDLLNDRPAASR